MAEEAKKLSDVVARRAAEKKEEDEKRKNELAIAPMKLKSGESVSDLRLSPDEKYVIAFIAVEAENAKRPIVPSYVTETGYTTDLPARTKVGDAQQASRVASISTTDGKVQWLKHGLKVVEPVKEAAKEATDATTRRPSRRRSKPRPRRRRRRKRPIATSRWRTCSGPTTARKRCCRCAPRTTRTRGCSRSIRPPATARVIAHEHDDAWVHWLSDGSAGFVPNSSTVWFISERTGWLHLYTVPYEGGEPRALTSGKYEVDEVTVSGRPQELLPDDQPGVAVRAASLSRAGHRRRADETDDAPRAGTTPTPSPDGTPFADRLLVHEQADGAVRQQHARHDVARAGVRELSVARRADRPRSPRATARRCPRASYKPANWNGGPAVIFVHGAGYLQNVHRGWSNYFREYMFHHLLMERGYLVLDIDYRASSGYGRDWRTAIYRHMGGVDLDDHVDAAKWLVARARRRPETHRHLRRQLRRLHHADGAVHHARRLRRRRRAASGDRLGALQPPATPSNILNTPQKDPEAYRQSSPIYFAEGLKGALLICHGVVDVNVHFQDTVRLAQRLIELRKENWEVAMYPLEDHSFVEPTSWADEYKRMLRLFETELK